MDLQQIYDLLEAHLDNSIERESIESMKRVKLPIPKEYGGGLATGNTMEDAVRNLINRLGVKPVKEYPSFNKCADDWLRIKEGQLKSPSTIADYKRVLRVHLKPFFKGKNISEITPDDIQLYYNSIIHLSKSYSQQSRAILNAIFERADRNGWLDKNPMKYSYEQSKKTGSKVVLQDENLLTVINQLDLLKDSKDIRDYFYACFLCFTALRRGEILGLKWKDLDFDKREISVRNNVTFPEGINEPCILTPKDESFGTVLLNSLLSERIQKYKGKPDEYILFFSKDERNRPMTKSMFTKMWNRCKKVLDFKGATSHSFRSTYASMMNAHCDHIDPKALQGALRHKTPDLALRVYTKPNDNKTRLAEEEYDKYLCEKLKG